MKFRIPLAKPEITDSDCQAVMDVLRTDQLSMGPKLAEFEEAICTYLNIPCAVAVNSGTSALHLGIRTLNIPEGAEVILPSFTFVSLLNVLLQERLHPVFVDIDPRTFNVDHGALEAAITSRTEAIIAVHTFGRPLQAEKFRSLADRHGLCLIEDACEAIGAEVDGKKVGNFGDNAALAFYPNKQMTTGEGGVFLSRDADRADRARHLRNQGRDPSLGWFQHKEPGFSYRLADLNCALGLSQLRRIEKTIERRQSLAKIYESKLGSRPEVIAPLITVPTGRISWFCYVIQLEEQFDGSARDWIANSLSGKGIGTGRYFAPLHRQPMMDGRSKKSILPVTDSVASRALALPFFNHMSDDEAEQVCSELFKSLDEFRRRKT